MTNILTDNGFRILKNQHINEIDSNATIYIHEKTSAMLIYLKNNEKEKTFAIGFKTPPNDDTGVAHIIEHSVFCGSEKFPVKEPFLELLKGSLNTFLNAMTYSDKTIYPFSSQNEEDFMNIMDIYLDAVFNPSIDKQKEIFMQEGWHYELESTNDNLTVNGVVYNEMKGAFSSPTTLLNNQINRTLFDNCYHYVSGGDPEFIPKLTYDNFINFYNKYYQPSNCCMYIYGDCNIDRVLKFIDTGYLSKFKNNTDKVNINSVAPFNKEKQVSIPYSINENESDSNKTYISLSYAVSLVTDEENSIAMRILADILVNSDAAPLKRALLDAKLCGNVYCMFNDTILQPTFNIIIENTDIDKLESIKNLVNKTLNNLSSKGIDKKLVEACINITEFSLREIGSSGMSKGLECGLNIINRWAYDEKDPLKCLYYNENIEKMKSNLNKNYFEELISKNILKNTHAAAITLYPKKGLNIEKENNFITSLQQTKTGLSADELNNIIEEEKSLKLRQNTPDTEKALETIPLLSLSDVDKKIIPLNIEENTVDGVKILYHNTFTGGIVYGNLYLDTSALTDDELLYLGILSNLLGMTATKNYSFEELSNEILINTGGIYFKTNAYSDSQDINKAYKYLEVSFKAISDKLPKAINLLKEIMFSSLLDDKKRLNEVINIIISQSQSRIISSGHQLSMIKLGAHFSTAFDYRDKSNAFTFFKNLKQLSDQYEQKSEQIIANIKIVFYKIFNKNNLTVSLTGEEKDKDIFLNELKSLICEINSNDKNLIKNTFTPSQKTEGIKITSDVNYVAFGYNFKLLDYKYNGSLEVLKTILSTDYLWNNIRIKGGAYGAMVALSPSGTMIFVSYRDPNILKTLETYKGIDNYIKDFNITNREMTKYILGTIQQLDQPLFPQEAGKTAAINYITHNTEEFRQKLRDEILSSTIADIKSKEDLISAIIKQNLYVVFGNSEKLETEKGMFDELITAL